MEPVPVPEQGRALGRALVQELEPVLARELERVQALEPVRVVARELEPERVSQRRAREVAARPWSKSLVA